MLGCEVLPLLLWHDQVLNEMLLAKEQWGFGLLLGVSCALPTTTVLCGSHGHTLLIDDHVYSSDKQSLKEEF